MIDYLKLGRNLQKFAPRVKAKTRTLIYNAKGIYDFKQMSPEIETALNNSLRDVEKPVLELSIKQSNRNLGTITIRDGQENISQDTFILKENTNIDEFLPKTDGCMEKLEYDKNCILQICQQNSLLKKLLPEFIKGLKNPKLELIFGKKRDFSICNIILKDGEKTITSGYFSKSDKNKILGEKIHFINENELITGLGDIRNSFCRQFERLNKALQKRLWLLDDRAKSIIKRRYGVNCSPQTSDSIAEKWNLTGARVRGIINESKKIMSEADTYCPELKVDLDNMGHILDDTERFNVYHRGSSIDINQAEEKIIRYKQNLSK